MILNQKYLSINSSRETFQNVVDCNTDCPPNVIVLCYCFVVIADFVVWYRSRENLSFANEIHNVVACCLVENLILLALVLISSNGKHKQSRNRR